MTITNPTAGDLLRVNIHKADFHNYFIICEAPHQLRFIDNEIPFLVIEVIDSYKGNIEMKILTGTGLVGVATFLINCLEKSI